MPPYQSNKSKAQQRKMFTLEARGEIAHGEAAGRARASRGKQLPERVPGRSRKMKARR